jgi:hypothetical protein
MPLADSLWPGCAWLLLQYKAKLMCAALESAGIHASDVQAKESFWYWYRVKCAVQACFSNEKGRRLLLMFMQCL